MSTSSFAPDVVGSNNLDLAVINQEIQETSLVQEDDEAILPIDTDRSALKVSMIKKNNEIIYQDSFLIKEERQESEMEKHI